MEQKVKWRYWLKWPLIMGATLVVCFVATVVIIFSSFEDVKLKAEGVCSKFSLGQSYEDIKNLSDEQKGEYDGYDVSPHTINIYFHKSSFLDIAGCELRFQDNKLIMKKVWVD